MRRFDVETNIKLILTN